MQQLSVEPQEEAIDSAPEELLGNDDDADLEQLQDDNEEGEIPGTPRAEDEGGSGAAPAAARKVQQQHADSHGEQQPTKKAKREPMYVGSEGAVCRIFSSMLTPV